MYKKIFSLFVFIRLYYGCLPSNIIFKKLNNRIKKFLKKDGLYGLKRALHRRFFLVEHEGGGEVCYLKIPFLWWNKEIKITFIDGDCSDTGVKRIQLLDLNRPKRERYQIFDPQVIEESQNRRWLW